MRVLELSFAVEGAEPVPYAMSPMLALKLRITNGDGRVLIQSIMLQCQIQLEVARRKYESSEEPGLLDLFGPPERWGTTLRTMLWTHASVNVRPFSGSATVQLPVPCTFDFNVAATKYFHALEGGEVPLCLLFSGTVFYEDEDRGLQVGQIPWEKEVHYRMPVSVWRQTVDLYYPNSAALMLRRDVFDRLHEYKMRNSIPTWEQAIERLLADVNEEVIS